MSSLAVEERKIFYIMRTYTVHTEYTVYYNSILLIV
jgi:hypothetical protein